MCDLTWSNFEIHWPNLEINNIGRWVRGCNGKETLMKENCYSNHCKNEARICSPYFSFVCISNLWMAYGKQFINDHSHIMGYTSYDTLYSEISLELLPKQQWEITLIRFFECSHQYCRQFHAATPNHQVLKDLPDIVYLSHSSTGMNYRSKGQ